MSALADRDYQQRVWISGVFPGDGEYYSWDMAIHALYDDSGLDEGSRRMIGTLFRDALEADAMDAVLAAIDAVFAEAGGVEAPVDEILRMPSWRRVVDAAGHARDLLQRHDREDPLAPPIVR